MLVDNISYVERYEFDRTKILRILKLPLPFRRPLGTGKKRNHEKRLSKNRLKHGIQNPQRDASLISNNGHLKVRKRGNTMCGRAKNSRKLGKSIKKI